MKKKFIDFLKSNFIIWCFIFIAIAIELTGVCVTSGKFFIRKPYLFVSLIAILTCVLFAVKKQKARYWCAFTFLLCQTVIDLVFIVVYDMTGATFDYAMLNLRKDAMAIIEGIPINFVFTFVAGTLISLYLVITRHIIALVPAPVGLLPRGVIAAVLATVLICHGAIVYFDHRGQNQADPTYKLGSGNDGTYYDLGILGNFVDELYRGAFFNKVSLDSEQELENYIFSSTNKPTENFGAAEGYNVVTILGETFEWFSFMNDLVINGEAQNAFPGGHTASEETLRQIYPNLYELYDTSVACMNHHSYEKTDVSENHSILGSYPSEWYINYDYPENSLPYSLPNVMKTLYDVDSYSFHDGDYIFYNRNVHHENALGFVEFTAREQMEILGNGRFTDYKSRDNEYCLDSEMIDVCKKNMFPNDRRFNTYITTITTHGQFAFRHNLIPEYNTLYNYGIIDTPIAKDGSNADAFDPFVYYVAAAMELDQAIGTMMKYLKETDDLTRTDESGKHPKLIDNTIIVLFGDHNAYYQTLSPQVKNLYLNNVPAQEDEKERNYTDLYRVPLMIRIGNSGIKGQITKFTTTVDIIPTILDLLGVKYYDNLYYGNSVFSDTVSVLYSRSYNVFVSDKLYFTSINNIRFKTEDTTEEDIEEMRVRAEILLKKAGRINQIFYYDFLGGERKDLFNANIKALNGISRK